MKLKNTPSLVDFRYEIAHRGAYITLYILLEAYKKNMRNRLKSY